MQMSCTGAGTPTVVIETAASASSLGWQAVQSQLSSTTRVCTYDRAGHGWSEPRTGIRDAETIVRELHTLLGEGGVSGPLLLIGHSAGGLYIREYAREFPGDVAGLVFIDASSPEQIDELPGFRAEWNDEVRAFPARLFWENVRVWSGWERLVGKCHNEPSSELQHLAGQYAAAMCRPGFVLTDESELPYFETSSRQAARVTSVGATPVAIISQDPAKQDDDADAVVWDREQEALKSLSSRSWRVIARGAGHAVHHDRLDLVVAESRRMIEYVRGGPEPPFGSTTTQ
jgi:pimeloyl-ACP methyl ester carboxylesterase